LTVDLNPRLLDESRGHDEKDQHNENDVEQRRHVDVVIAAARLLKCLPSRHVSAYFGKNAD